MTRHDHDDSDEHKRHDAAKGPPGENRQDPEKQKAFPEKDRHSDEVETHTRPENQTNAALGADISDRKKRRPSHRADLTRNLRHPPHMGRRTPFSTMLFDNGNDEPPGGPATRRSAGRYSLRHMAAMLMIIVAGGIGGAAIMKATLSHQSASPDFFTSLPMTASRAYRLYANDKEHPDSKSALNAESLEILKDCRIEPILAEAKPGDRFQFLRMGYFCADSKDFTSDAPVFNRAVTLRDTWAKIIKQNK